MLPMVVEVIPNWVGYFHQRQTLQILVRVLGVREHAEDLDVLDWVLDGVLDAQVIGQMALLQV